MSGSDGIAAALAVLPTNVGAPRVIQQFTSVFLVSRIGELWRVYDVENLDAGERRMPTPDSRTPYRVFIALARKAQMRVHAFASNASRDLDPVSVQAQLDASVAR